jgi:hypothetical protein
MNTLSKLVGILVICLLVSACGPRQVFGPTITPTATITSAPTLTLASTSTSTSTNTPTLTSTITPTLTSTITFIPFPDAPHLSTLMLSPEDVIEAMKTADFLNIFNTFEIFAFDKSQDLKSSCIIECTRQVWFKKGDPQTITITMIRSKDEQEASHIAAKMYNASKPFGYEYGVEEFSWVDAPEQNTHIGDYVAGGWIQITLTTSRGSISIQTVYKCIAGEVDLNFMTRLVADFTNLQIFKLKRANVIP